MSLKRIRLTLARDTDFPLGSDSRGYEFVAPLQADGHIDPAAWRKHRDDCRVRRFWPGEDDELGHLIHTRGRRWAFHYDLKGAVDDDETGYRFDSHVFKPGEYVSIQEHDGALRTFRVEAVRDYVNGATDLRA
ncbi:MAG: hypothetical protein AAF495_12855 [Pseudomonadota bacterium]